MCQGSDNDVIRIIDMCAEMRVQVRRMINSLWHRDGEPSSDPLIHSPCIDYKSVLTQCGIYKA